MQETTVWARRGHSVASCALIVAWSLPRGDPSPQSALAPPFVGTAAPGIPATSCPQIVPRGIRNPFGNGYNATRSRITVANYRFVGCWVDMLAARPFVYDEYASAQGAGLAVAYGGTLVAHEDAGARRPSSCASQACPCAGASKRAQVNLQTGGVRSDPQEQRSCAPPRLPARYVLGLTGRRYPVGIELRK